MVTTDLSGGDSTLKTCVVFNGRGFTGRSLVSRLLRVGGWYVRVVDSKQSLKLDPSSESDSVLDKALSTGLASYHCVDIRDKFRIAKAIEGSYVAFYMMPDDLLGHDFYHCYMVLVQGAKNVLNACRRCKVRQLVYNSSTDVVFDGSQDIVDGDESLPYPWKFPDMLTELKAQAEALILLANDVNGVLTCALRPSNVFGPGDSYFLPSLVNLAKAGCAKFIIGSGGSKSDFTYAENVAHAHICAAEALDSQTMCVAGKAFFITNLKPIKFWDFSSRILEGLGYQRSFIKIPGSIFRYILLLAKGIENILGLRLVNCYSPYYIIQLASTTITFNGSAAQKHIGYSPVVSLEGGVASTIKSFSHLAKDLCFARYGDFDNHSKAAKLLGGGKVADILLWREEKITFTCFLVLVLLLYFFFLSGGTFASSAAQLLIVVALGLYIYGILPSNMFGVSVKRTHSPCFAVSESFMRDSVRTVASLWNRGVPIINLVVRGGDWYDFIKVVISLYLLKLTLLTSIIRAFGVALVFLFTGFFVYEQYESEVDELATFVFYGVMELKGLLIRKTAAVVHKYGIISQHQKESLEEKAQRKRVEGF